MGSRLLSGLFSCLQSAEMDSLVLGWPVVALGLISLTYVPYLFLRIPAVHQKLAQEKKKGYDIRVPRESQAAATDGTPEGRYIARLSGHHANCFEFFPMFALGVFAALHRGVPEARVNWWASAVLAQRLVYSGLFIAGTNATLGNARALVWTVGLGICCYLIAFASP